jgi:hypothetical protein
MPRPPSAYLFMKRITREHQCPEGPPQWSPPGAADPTVSSTMKQQGQINKFYKKASIPDFSYVTKNYRSGNYRSTYQLWINFCFK